MAAIVKELGLELPVFDIDPMLDVVHRKHDLRHITELPDDTFVRRIGMFAPEGYSLKDTLRATDEQLCKIAEYAGGAAISHKWGLVKTDPAYNHMIGGHGLCSPYHIVPDGYALVAETAIVDATERTPAEKLRFDHLVTRSIVKHQYKRFFSRTGFFLSDMGASQFLYGTSRAVPEAGETAWLIDIEPRFMNRRLPPFSPRHRTTLWI